MKIKKKKYLVYSFLFARATPLEERHIKLSNNCGYRSTSLLWYRIFRLPINHFEKNGLVKDVARSLWIFIRNSFLILTMIIAYILLKNTFLPCSSYLHYNVFQRQLHCHQIYFQYHFSLYLPKLVFLMTYNKMGWRIIRRDDNMWQQQKMSLCRFNYMKMDLSSIKGMRVKRGVCAWGELL